MSVYNARGFDISIADPKIRIQAYIDTYTPDYDGFDSLLMNNVRVVSARARQSEKEDFEAFCVFELEVLPGLSNSIGRMHGGAVALLADMSTNMATAPVSQKGFWEHGGVTRTLNITLLQPIPSGITVSVECALRSIGKRLSVTTGVIKDKASGKTLALAEHGKSALSDQDPRDSLSSRL